MKKRKALHAVQLTDVIQCETNVLLSLLKIKDMRTVLRMTIAIQNDVTEISLTRVPPESWNK